MEMLIIVLQIVCVAVLALGATLSLLELMQRSGSDCAVASDLETGFRHLARSRR
ncbi:MAG TPA: hypothetical protein VK143_00650 [Burkholderiales bacterium]|nr:hypothetical protein [Burkholderiales bacterium]